MIGEIEIIKINKQLRLKKLTPLLKPIFTDDSAHKREAVHLLSLGQWHTFTATTDKFTQILAKTARQFSIRHIHFAGYKCLIHNIATICSPLRILYSSKTI